MEKHIRERGPNESVEKTDRGESQPDRLEVISEWDFENELGGKDRDVREKQKLDTIGNAFVSDAEREILKAKF